MPFISIHALRVEGDGYVAGLLATSTRNNFYPRPPGGGRPGVHSGTTFVSTISIHALRVEGDRVDALESKRLYISIHALRVEGDLRKSDSNVQN